MIQNFKKLSQKVALLIGYHSVKWGEKQPLNMTSKKMRTLKNSCHVNNNVYH
jgi:hypothetical protein